MGDGSAQRVAGVNAVLLPSTVPGPAGPESRLWAAPWILLFAHLQDSFWSLNIIVWMRQNEACQPVIPWKATASKHTGIPTRTQCLTRVSAYDSDRKGKVYRPLTLLAG